jgi:pimeloyl-ACP methyl ester carboxylesterase
VLADAVRRTHQLSGIFKSKVAAPRRTFLIGASMGALVAVKLAETQASQYDGALALCGPLGGALPELQYVGDGRVIFDFYFPGVLPGTPFEVPAGTSFLSPFDPGGPSPLFLSVAAALAASPSATFRWASAANLPFNNLAELANSALTFTGVPPATRRVVRTGLTASCPTTTATPATWWTPRTIRSSTPS